PEMDAERLKRLVDEAVRESREAAATEGYFSARVNAEVDASGEQWVVRLKIEPGERTRVHNVDIRFSGPAAEDPQAHALLKRVRESREAAATEGYFSARVNAEVDASGEQWVVRLKIEPGERTRVHNVDIRFSGPAAEDPQAHALLKRVRENWPLRPGLPFRQED